MMMQFRLPDDAIILDQVTIYRYINESGEVNVGFIANQGITAYDLKAMLSIGNLAADRIIEAAQDG
jgi:hypothetical protein